MQHVPLSTTGGIQACVQALVSSFPTSSDWLGAIGGGQSCVETITVAHPDLPGDRQVLQKASRDSSCGS